MIPRGRRYILLTITFAILAGVTMLIWNEAHGSLWMRCLASACLGFAMREAWKAFR